MKIIVVCASILALAVAMTFSSFTLYWNPHPMQIVIEKPEGTRL